MNRLGITLLLTLVVFGFVVGCVDTPVDPSPPARDPGVRGGVPGAGAPIAGLTKSELEFFEAGKEEFVEEEGIDEGLGPTMNLGSCAGCHLQPAVGGSSPSALQTAIVGTTTRRGPRRREGIRPARTAW